MPRVQTQYPRLSLADVGGGKANAYQRAWPSDEALIDALCVRRGLGRWDSSQPPVRAPNWGGTVTGWPGLPWWRSRG